MDNNTAQTGLVHIYTGDGKGKTTAAIGLALRAAGQGLNTVIIQFLKGDSECGEHVFASRFRPFEIVQFTKGNCFNLPDEQLLEDVNEAIGYAREVTRSGEYQIVVLDEIFVAIDRGLLNTSAVVDLIRGKHEHTELVLTGRDAPPEIIDHADYLTEMKLHKHPFLKGVTARKGIEY
ncbi:MAG: cob(I)yrinic acid a,c-diamide adenosyltransferase [Dehalococcoidia bacterium]